MPRSSNQSVVETQRPCRSRIENNKLKDRRVRTLTRHAVPEWLRNAAAANAAGSSRYALTLGFHTLIAK